jgi:hypothetical protein
MTRSLALFVVATAVAVAICAGRTVRAAPDPIGDQLQAEMTRLMAVPWSAAHPVEWGDFQGPAPDGGAEGARTVYSLLYGVRCARHTFQFGVEAAFLPRSSWVLPVVLADTGLSRRTLDHERTHFNLTEVFARRMRKYFTGLYDPCGQSEDVLRASADRFVADEENDQARYDEETGHGLTAVRQRAWDTDVTEQLASLKAFGAQP